MMIGEELWEDYHHRSHLPNEIKDYSNELNHPSIIDFLLNSVRVDTVDFECNLSNIEETISINISTKPNIVENIHFGKSCSPLELDNYHALFREFKDIFAWPYEEMLGIGLSIVEHEIKMYPDVKLVRQRLRPIHPKKELQLKQKLKNFCALVSFTMYLLLTGFLTLFLSLRNNRQFDCVLIIGM